MVLCDSEQFAQIYVLLTDQSVHVNKTMRIVEITLSFRNEWPHQINRHQCTQSFEYQIRHKFKK